MCTEDKCRLLNELVEPFGYAYVPSQDIFTSRIDCWQRELGYCTLYDNAAAHFGMVFDALPIYFHYRGRTWLLEFWKGQYGINTGCEIGLYYADHILSEEERTRTLFRAVDNSEMLRLSFALSESGEPVANLTGTHWWLTAFDTGRFSEPRDLCLRASVVFPNPEMAQAFINGLCSSGYTPQDICCHCNTVTFTMDRVAPINGIFRRLRKRISQWTNRFWCRVYLFISRPFCRNVDRILYLYYYLPFAFRKTLRIRKYKKYKSGREASRQSGRKCRKTSV